MHEVYNLGFLEMYLHFKIGKFFQEQKVTKKKKNTFLKPVAFLLPFESY